MHDRSSRSHAIVTISFTQVSNAGLGPINDWEDSNFELGFTLFFAWKYSVNSEGET